MAVVIPVADPDVLVSDPCVAELGELRNESPPLEGAAV